MVRLRSLAASLLASLLLFSASVATAALVVTVTNPRYPLGTGPVVAVDQGHNNFHNLDGRYQIFGELLTKDGYRVRPITSFTAENLAGVDILVTATALDPANAAIVEPEKNGWVLSFNPLAPPNFAKGLYPVSAYSDAEISTVRDWVKAGGSLMLVADHMPFPASAQAMGKAFGVVFENNYVFDQNFLLFAASRGQLGGNSGNFLKFYRNPAGKTDSQGKLYSHTITNGLDYVTSFVGSSFRVMPGISFQPLMEMTEGTLLHYPYNHVAYEKSPQSQLSLPLGEGALQGATLLHGGGRVAVFGEAAMFSAREADNNGIFNPSAPFNQQFVRNTLAWLADKSTANGNCLIPEVVSPLRVTLPNINLGGLKMRAVFTETGALTKVMNMAAAGAPDTAKQELNVVNGEISVPCINVGGQKHRVVITNPSGQFDGVWVLKESMAL